MFQHIDHIAIHCSDIERSIAFYRDCFGFTVTSRHQRPNDGGIAFLALGGTALELTEHKGETVSGMHVALAADSMDAAVKHLAAKGLTPVIAPKVSGSQVAGEPVRLRAMFEGPDGELIELRAP